MSDQSPDPTDPQVALALAKIEAKLDVAIAQHGAQLQDHERRIGSLEQENREQDTRINATARDIATVRETVRSISESASSSKTTLPVWIGLGVTVFLAILSPILAVLIVR